MSNPFTPDWGVWPPVLVGRDDHLARAERAFRAGPRDPFFTHAYYGERGIGKTVLLDAVGSRAQSLGWPVLHTAVRGGRFVEVLARAQLPDVAAALGERPATTGETAVTAGFHVGVVHGEASRTRRRRSAEPRPLAAELEDGLRTAGDLAAGRGVGVLVTVDEVHAAEPDELSILSQSLQLVTKRGGRPVALVVAGLPHTPSVLSGADLTFLERMPKVELGFLGVDATRLALAKPAADIGVRLDADALELLVAASGGYPYLVQLLGYHALELTPVGGVVTLAVARGAIDAAAATVDANLFRPRWERLAGKEREFLRAMAAHGTEPVPVASVVSALGASAYEDISYLRARLLAKGVIRPDGRGLLRFTFPGMGAWVRSQGGDPGAP